MKGNSTLLLTLLCLSFGVWFFEMAITGKTIAGGRGGYKVTGTIASQRLRLLLLVLSFGAFWLFVWLLRGFLRTL